MNGFDEISARIGSPTEMPLVSWTPASLGFCWRASKSADDSMPPLCEASFLLETICARLAAGRMSAAVAIDEHLQFDLHAAAQTPG